MEEREKKRRNRTKGKEKKKVKNMMIGRIKGQEKGTGRAKEIW